MKRVRLLVILVGCVSAVASCQLIDRFIKGDVIARVGGDVLYAYQVEELLPKDCTPEDSAHIVSAFIDSWATRQLILRQAEKNLSKSDLNIEKEMEELRRGLLAYRYEMKYVDTHLDTIITESECAAYYRDNSHTFVSDTYIIRGRYVKIPSSSPNLDVVKRLCRSNVQKDLDKLDEICFSSAEKYFLYDDKWISLDVIASEFGESVSFCEKELAMSRFVEFVKEGYTYLLFVTEYVSPGEQEPLEYCQNHIREILLSRRKQELVADLERNLLTDAKSSGFLTIYNER